MANDTISSLIGISSHHLVLTLILALFVVVLVGAGFALASGVRPKRHRDRQEELSTLEAVS
jgi:VIT1/CCC1 family predicted Fe2+/Mn2+ transporter